MRLHNASSDALILFALWGKSQVYSWPELLVDKVHAQERSLLIY
jgi:hypothetical protein